MNTAQCESTRIAVAADCQQSPPRSPDDDREPHSTQQSGKSSNSVTHQPDRSEVPPHSKRERETRKLRCHAATVTSHGQSVIADVDRDIRDDG